MNMVDKKALFVILVILTVAGFAATKLLDLLF